MTELADVKNDLEYLNQQLYHQLNLIAFYVDEDKQKDELWDLLIFTQVCGNKLYKDMLDIK